MDEIIAVFMFLAEVLMLLQCLEISFAQEVRLDKYTIGIIGIDLLIYTGIAFNVLPPLCTYIVYIAIFLYSYLEFKRSVVKTIIKTMIGLALGVCLEVIILCVMVVFHDKYGVDIVTTLSSVLSLILSYIIKKSIILLENQKVIKGNERLILIAILSVLALGAVLDLYLDQGFMEIYFAFILVVVVFALFYLRRLEAVQREIDKKNHELEVQKIYGGAYEDLLTEVRRKQHDFKNQLGAIYSMHLVAQSQEDEETVMFSVANPAKYMSSADIEKMFIRGYSKKGENRGIGLARVLELVKKYKAEIKAANDTCEEENWINFTLSIGKQAESTG